MYEKVKAYIRKNGMIDRDDVVAAGVSGGGDSMAMLDVLDRLRREWGFHLMVVHVNHGIRGGEAARDQNAVEQACAERGVPCTVKTYDVPRIAGERRLGEEETGRILRREAFFQAALPFRQDGKRVRIALAHNRNDLAETILHHMARGSGIRGLSGMAPVSGEIIRPFLCLERKEIDHYLEERKILHVLDSTNLSDDYTRNRIRHHILPALEREVNAGTVAHLAEVSLVLRQADDYLCAQAEKLLADCRRPEGKFFLGEEFFAAEPVLISYGILEALGELAGKRKDLSAVHVRQVAELYEKQPGHRVSLPCGVEALRDYGGVTLRRTAPAAGADPAAEGMRGVSQWTLPAPGKLSCPMGTFFTKIFFYNGQKIPEKKCTKWLDYDKINEDLAVRTRKSGDYLVFDEKGSKKKLKNFFIDEKIPREERDRLALVARGPEILWIAGGRMSGRYRITSGTKRVLEIRFEKDGENTSGEE